MKTRYGGELEIGDFIIVAYNNYTSFGWYCGQGKNTIQYYQYRVPAVLFAEFQKWQTQPDSAYRSHLFDKHGFSSKVFYKEYINADRIEYLGSRVVKITDPEAIFTTQEDLDYYLKSREVLINIKFPAK